MLRWFAGKQIRNVAAIGGNIMTGSPISDLNPIFLAAGCCLQIGSVNGETEVKFDENFYTGSKMETEYSELPSIRLRLIRLSRV